MTLEQLVKFLGVRARAELYYPILIKYLEPAGILKTKARLVDFMAQVGHESALFSKTREVASGKAYDTRTDLGNTPEVDGDGEKYKGRGLIQVTGKNNYRECSQYLFGDERLLDTPELLEKPEWAVASAVWYWRKNNLVLIADKPSDWKRQVKLKRDKEPRTYRRFEYLTLRINGGLNHLGSREILRRRAEAIFS